MCDEVRVERVDRLDGVDMGHFMARWDRPDLLGVYIRYYTDTETTRPHD